MICEQNPLSQIPVFPLPLSLSLYISSPQEKPARAATAEIMLRYISGPRQARKARSSGAYAMKMTQIWNKKGFHDSPLCRQAKWSVNMKARLSMKKKGGRS